MESLYEGVGMVKATQISWDDVDKLIARGQITIVYRKWQAEELRLKRGKRSIYQLPNRTYGVMV
jgi:hypothetical protein